MSQQQITHPKSSSLNWFLWWRVTPEEIQYEAEHYHTLEYKRSKGRACLWLLFFSFLILVAATVNIVQMQQLPPPGLLGAGIFNIVIGVIWAWRVYQGKKRTMIISMILFTILQTGNLVTMDKPNAVPLFVWMGMMHLFFKAYKVEVYLETKKTKAVSPSVK